MTIVRTRLLVNLIAGLALAGFTQARAATVTVDFTSTQYRSSSTAVWNTSAGQIHAPVEIVGTEIAAPPAVTTSLDLGDGRHGAFDLTTYAQFDSDGNSGDSIITINTETFPTLQFTSFNLAAGWTLKPTGSQPLVIKSHGEVLIAGTIDCSGDDGEVLSSDNSAEASGGTGRCGGGNGGVGRSLTTALATAQGASGGASVAGGTGGNAAGASGGAGGGGGGGYPFDPGTNGAAAGVDPNTTGGEGAAGASLSDANFTEIGGGSGGGGGMYHNLASADDSSGGGGGAGGGVVLITAMGDITVDGSILANGGNGGGDTGTLLGGAGGGGSGGSIGLFAKGEVYLNGPVQARPGVGGISTGGNGGDGAYGRMWNVGDTGGSFNSFNEDPSTPHLVIGEVDYKISPPEFVATSSAIDFSNSSPTLTAVTPTTSGTGNLTVEVASGATSDFTPSWQPVASMLNVPLSRYVRFRVSLDNQNNVTGLVLSSLQFDYDRHRQDEFNLVSGCGRVSTVGSGALSMIWLLAVFLPFFFLLAVRLLSAKKLAPGKLN